MASRAISIIYIAFLVGAPIMSPVLVRPSSSYHFLLLVLLLLLLLLLLTSRVQNWRL